MDVGSLNEQRTALLIEHLAAHGIERICLSPGSRSTALALATSKARVRCDTHFDERGLGFYALGCAKGSGKPVALLVTSGTAVGNLMPAVMEASNDHVPLVLITADRPQELRDCSANQTCDQVKLFTPYVRWQGDLPLSDPQFPPSSLAAAIGQALFLCQKPRPGPVHLNCMLREPFFSAHPLPATSIAPRRCESGELIPTPESIAHWIQQLAQVKRGLIIVGSMSMRVDAIFELAEKLGWPIYADILSQMRTHSHPHLISYFDLLVQTGQDKPIEAVLHFGQRTTSKSASEWLKKQSLQFYLHISDFPTLTDPYHSVTHRLHASSARTAHMLARPIPGDADPEWCKTWKERDIAVSQQLNHIFSQDTNLSEPAVIRSIAASIAPDVGLFLANSMPIRDADKFFPTLPYPLPICANRGVSGIDGNIATAIGIAQGMHKPLIALLGDLAFLHDLNSLALIAKSEYPLCLVIINNGGGGIFSFLPVQEKKESFEKFFACAHDLTFASAAALFRIPYAQPQTAAELDEALEGFVRSKKSLLLEICTDRSENRAIHDHITSLLKNESCLVGACSK